MIENIIRISCDNEGCEVAFAIADQNIKDVIKNVTKDGWIQAPFSGKWLCPRCVKKMGGRDGVMVKEKELARG